LGFRDSGPNSDDADLSEIRFPRHAEGRPIGKFRIQAMWDFKLHLPFYLRIFVRCPVAHEEKKEVSAEAPFPDRLEGVNPSSQAWNSSAARAALYLYRQPSGGTLESRPWRLRFQKNR